MQTPVINIQNLDFDYQGQTVLQNVNLTIHQGEFLGMVGPNGGGKTTLFRLILGLIQPRQGQITVLNQSPHQARRAIGYVPQALKFPVDFPMTVEEAVLMGRLGPGHRLGFWKKKDRDAIIPILDETGLMPLRERRLEDLSGGQRQRVFIARALAGNPKLLLLDEPTANIDVQMEEDLFQLFRQLNQRMTIVVVSHDLGFVSHYVSRIACVNRSLHCHNSTQITPELIEHMYGHPVRVSRFAQETA